MSLNGLTRTKISQFLWTSTSKSSKNPSDSSDPLIDTEKQQYTESPPSSPIHSTLEASLPQSRTSLCTRCLHLLIWSSLIAFLIWAFGALFYRVEKFETHLLSVKTNNGEMEVVHWSYPPETPIPVFFSDSELDNRWTISIPKTEEFPLSPQKLIGICSQSHQIYHRLHMDEMQTGPQGYYESDPDYMQVSEAISSGILPTTYPAHSNSVVEGIESDIDTDYADPVTGICKRSLTFVMQSTDTGLGPSLMSLWLSYGMAKYEKRAFFIDDRNWAYGSWSTFFAPPPSSSCKPPPEVHRVPCPHQADHLLISTATTAWNFGHKFEDEFENPYKMEVERQIQIFDMMRQGYEALFHLASGDAKYVTERVQELNKTVHPGMSVGIHIRHGDKHPYTQKYSEAYIPPVNYVTAANDELIRRFNTHDKQANQSIAGSRMILASDSAAVYNYWEEGAILRAQHRILISTPSISAPTFPDMIANLPLPFEDGFFSSKFPEIKGSAARFSSDPGLEYKALLGRTYLMDLAVLGSMDRVVCAVGSVGCRLLAVMMGWDRAIMKKEWVNVDGEWDWEGVRW